ncbi:hypothetical protein FBF86_10600 [Serratia marcescens]|uniref:hypothetical protein n=1 Tax=Serratia TaxID=613 RepID=UPI00114D5083|nr:hypothetical protein [Serratia marcescens]QDI18392.1 hypothetical protein FBF86_10600 [Serratia marcescens]QDI28135.1 hypothetical protein FG169_10600 [Serratia marcescens]QDI42642.1 hypothetical protein FG172_10825 [Serratia marcescens]QDI57071.1 hypothetical protein FG175_10825 [Serratia marcescens]QLJ65624.1 hypothetical protein HP437_10740 [Serratia marcescens]
MDVTSNCFERKWFYVFMFMYLLVMMPFPFFYNTAYQPGWLGVPVFIFGWLIHGVTVIALIVLFAWQCLQRPEYQDDIEEDNA